MPYVSTLERQAMEQGRQKGLEQGLERGMERGLERGMERGMEQGMERGLEQGRTLELLENLELMLELRFGSVGMDMLADLRQISDWRVLRAVRDAIKKAATPEDLRRVYQAFVPPREDSDAMER